MARDVFDVPDLHDLAVRDPVHVHVTDVGGLAGCWTPHHWPGVRPFHSPVHGDRFALRDYAIGRDLYVGEPRPEHGDCVKQPRPPELRARRRAVVHDIFGDDLRQRRRITCGKCGKESASDELVLFGHATSDHGAGRG